MLFFQSFVPLLYSIVVIKSRYKKEVFNMWYKNSYRRHLCDMHINDWNDEFLSKFSPEEYFENLKRAKVQNAMIYFQSHAGHCFYPTKTGKMHEAFRGREDMIKRLVRMCRENGITVTGYYSVIYNTWAYINHPEWRMVSEKGKPNYGEPWDPNGGRNGLNINRYGLCCPNNPEYREFVSAQMKEIAEYFDYDGMFFDMLYWSRQCQCEHCKKRFLAETGHELPEVLKQDDPISLLALGVRRKWMGQFAQSLTDEMKSYSAGEISVEHNVASAALPSASLACGKEVIDACDYAGGDLYGDMYNQSFTCKFYRNATKNQPFEYMFSRCKPDLGAHTVTKSFSEMLSAVCLTTAHHGATLVIDAVNPVGTLDKRLYERIGDVFEKTAVYEKYLTGEMIEDMGLYYSHCSKAIDVSLPYSNHIGTVNLTNALVENNISFGITGSYHDISKYGILVAPYLTDEDKDDYARLTDYVKNGGNLYISGGKCEGLIKEFFGADVVGQTDGTKAYVAPANDEKAKKAFGWFNEDYPIPFSTSSPVISGYEEKDVIAKIVLPYTTRNEAKFASIHSDPPGIKTDVPAILFKEYGKGKVIWSSLPFECMERKEHYSELFLELLREFFGIRQTVVSDAPYDVEVIAFKDNEEYTVSSVQLCERKVARHVEPFEVCVKTDKKPSKLLKLPDEAECEFTYDNGFVKYTVDGINDMLDMRKIVL